MGKPIKVNLFFKFVSIIFLINVIPFIILMWFSKVKGIKIIREELEVRANSLATKIAFESKYGVLNNNKEFLDGVIQQVFLIEKDIILVRITDEEDMILAEKLRKPKNLPLKFSITVPIRIKNFFIYKKHLKFPSQKQVQRVVGKNIGKVELTVSVTDMYMLKAKKARKEFFFLFFLIIMIDMLGGVFLIKITVDPIKRLVKGTKIIAGGDLNCQVEVFSSDEIGLLTGSFNEMTKKLKKSQNNLTQRRNKLEEKTRELELKNKEMEIFIYSVSHDLKAPLVVVDGFAANLHTNCKNRLGKKNIYYLERIRANIDQMESLIEDLLELSRVGRVKGNLEFVNIVKIINLSREMFSTALKKKEIRFYLKGPFPLVWGDCNGIKQVFDNLIGNAVKFIGDKKYPEIEIGYYNDDENYWTFYVKDTGIGISSGYHEKIFEAFHRLKDIETEGTGVGLSIVKKIIDNYGGKIWVESEEGKGTIFYFTLLKKSKDDLPS